MFMALDYQPKDPDEDGLKPQRYAAIILVVCGAASILGAWGWASFDPTNRTVTTMLLLGGWAVAILGGVWYGAVRWTEENT